MTRLVLLVTSPRVAPGLLSADAWSVLRGGPVLTADPDHAQIPPLTTAGVPVTVLDPQLPPAAMAGELVAAAGETGTATWLAAADGEPALPSALAALGVGLEMLPGSWDPPGARLLDVVATMDRLRSPGGCPWDAAQNHETLAPYLLEEAYEAFQAIEDRDPAALREELGDVLLQVAFHARLAEELPEDRRWSIDDVAAGLVDKLVRRHPHVFGDVQVRDADEVNANWEAIKARERGDAAAVSGVPLAAAALTLAATLQRKAARSGVPAEQVVPELAVAESPAAAIAAAASAVQQSPSMAAAGALLWTVVAVLRGLDIDAESALRGRSREFRDALLATETPPRGLPEGR